MKSRQSEIGEVELFDLEYKLLLMPVGQAVNPEKIPQNTIALRLTKSGEVGAYLPKHHLHILRPIEYIKLSPEELCQLHFPGAFDSPEIIAENDSNKELVNKITTICGCRCNFLDFYSTNEKKLSLARKNLTVEAIPSLCNFLQTYPDIEILDISCNEIGKERKSIKTEYERLGFSSRQLAWQFWTVLANTLKDKLNLIS
jgi:hypothetical protein